MGCIYNYIILLVILLKNTPSLFMFIKYSKNDILIGTT